MYRRIPFMAATAGGGLLTAAFLQAAVAAAQPDSGADVVSNFAFTADGTTLDPGADGFTSINPIFAIAPLLQIGGAEIQPGVFLNPQSLEVYDSSGAELGSVETGVNASNILGIDSAQFTVSAVTPNVETIESGLADSSGISFGPGSDFDVADLANALADRNLDFGTDITPAEITQALAMTDIGNALGVNYLGQFDPDSVAPGITFTPGAAADALNAVSTADLPTDGTVYSITNLGLGIHNVYEAIPNADGTEAATIHDTLVTPLGNIDLPTSYDAVAYLNPGNAFDGLGPAGAGLSDSAFSIGGTTFDPGVDGFTTVNPLFGIAPLLEIGGGALSRDIVNPAGFSDYQNLGVYDSSGTELGSVTAGVDTSNILGIDSTELTVTGSAPTVAAVETALDDSTVNLGGYDGVSTADIANALLDHGTTAVLGGDVSGSDVSFALDPFFGTKLIDFDNADFTAQDIANALNAAQAPDLPADGTVYSVTDLGGGIHLVYEAIPNADGTAASSISDTLVTPLGNIDLPTTFDAVANLDPGGPLDALGTAGAGGADLSDYAFTIGGTTFDPGSGGFDSVPQLFAIAPLLELGGLSAGPGVNTAGQFLEVYNSSGTEIGSVTTGLHTSDILGIDSTQLMITGVAADPGVDVSQLPVDGTVYSVTNLGGGFENVYEAIPNGTGTAASSITDTLVTPFGDINLSTPFDAVADLMPGNATAGLDAVGSGLFGDLFGDLFGSAAAGSSADIFGGLF